jgi:hypothetical protein
MAIRFFDTQHTGNPANGKTITGGKELRDLLNSLQYGDAFFCELLAPNASKLLLGIGSDIGCVQYSSGDGTPPYLMATAATRPPADTYAGVPDRRYSEPGTDALLSTAQDRGRHRRPLC